MEKKKKTIQDIKPSTRKTTRTVSSSVRRPSKPLEIETIKVKKTKDVGTLKDKKKNPMIMWIIAIVSIGALVIAFSTLFVRATITVIPKSIPFSLNNESFTAEKDSTNNLSFQTITVSGTKSLPVDAKDSEEASSRAEGKVILFNSFSTKPVNLLIDTRLESSKGILYKTKKAVVIPGLKEENGQTTPGQISVDVYADEPGTSGNDDLTDFVVVGFKGSPKETKIYGRSETPMMGGVVGLVYKISDNEYSTSYESLRRNLEDDLQTKLYAEVPSRFFVVPNSVVYTSTSKPAEKYSESQTAILIEDGTLTAYIIDREQLSSKIAEKVLTVNDGVPYDVIIPDIEKLNFSTEADVDANKLFIKISGENEIIWNIDEERIAYDTRATYRRQFGSIMDSYPMISEASLVIKPFWRRTLPEKVENIKVVNKRFD